MQALVACDSLQFKEIRAGGRSTRQAQEYVLLASRPLDLSRRSTPLHSSVSCTPIPKIQAAADRRGRFFAAKSSNAPHASAATLTRYGSHTAVPQPWKSPDFFI